MITEKTVKIHYRSDEELKRRLNALNAEAHSIKSVVECLPEYTAVGIKCVRVLYTVTVSFPVIV